MTTPTPKMLISLALIAMSLNVTAAPDPLRLERILTCQEPASPSEVQTLIKNLGGTPIVMQAQSNVSYGLPNPIYLYGQPSQFIDIRPTHDDMGEYVEYSARISGASVAEIASFADVKRNSQGLYVREIGQRDLSIRPEAGVIAVVCGNNVRNLGKSIRAIGRDIANSAESSTYPQ